MNTFTAICGHSAPVIGAPGSVSRATCDISPCPDFMEKIEEGNDEPFALIESRIAEQDTLIRQLSERVAVCSELLSRAAERHDNADKLRAEIAAVVDGLQAVGVASADWNTIVGARVRLRKLLEGK